MPRIIAVMPAFNAEKTLGKTVGDIPGGSVDKIILVDDASKDRTVEEARKLGIEVIEHKENKGYGANQKTCYRAALKEGADIIVMIHPDYQYDSRLIPLITSFISYDICDFMLGNRIRTRAEALSGGMPLYKYLANRFLTILENLLLGQNLGEAHSGFRAYSRKVLETIPWEDNSDDFVFDQQMIIQATAFKFRLGDIPVPARYFAEASSINFFRSTRYGFETLWALLRYLLHNSGILKCRLFQKK